MNPFHYWAGGWIGWIGLLVSLPLFAAVNPSLPEILTKEYDFNALERITLSNTSGTTNIVPLSGQSVSIRATKRVFQDGCSLTIERPTVAEIVIKVEQSLVAQCDVDFELQVPRTISLDLISGSGNISIKDIEGSLAYALGSGNIEAEGKFTQIKGRSGSGNAKISGVVGKGLVTSGSGNVDVKFSPLAKGDFSAKTGSGNASLAVSKQSLVSTSFITGSGEVQNELVDSPRPELALDARSGSGNIKVHSY